MMNPEVKAKWVEALRSDKYKQGKSYLKVGDTFCCLGVLCDISGLAKWKRPATITAPPGVGMYLDAETTLPGAVMSWAGLREGNPEIPFTDGGFDTLADVNDGGASFGEIADLIEKHL
jgi:hypothetical protein